MGFGQWMDYTLRLRLHDLTEYASDLIKFSRHSKYAFAGETAGKLGDGRLGKKVAIVAIYPTSDIMFSIRNICSALSKNGYSILLVSSIKVAPHLKEQLLEHCTMLFERYGFGRDFGSYAAAINLLDKRGDLGNLDSLVLANDSMFWPSDFSGEIQSLESVDGEWKALFEHQKCGRAKYHAQSFFLMFGARVVNHPEFRNFWSDYTPWSAREHAIWHGEVGLSQCLKKSGFHPHIAYTFPRIWAALLSRIDNDQFDQPLKTALVEMTGADFTALGTKSISLSDRGTIGKVGLRDQLIVQAIQYISSQIFEANPTHGAGLLCNVLLGAPIKRDICSRYGKQIGVVLATAQGFEDRDIEKLHVALRAKGSISQYGDFDRFMLHKGRI